MIIRKVDTFIVEIPFHDGGKGQGITPTTWHTLENVLVRIEDDQGYVGWGEAFGYFTADATKATIDRLIAPVLEGSTVEDIGAWNLKTQRQLHLFGRYGVTMFAISGVDIALWDLAAQRRGVPLHRLFTEKVRSHVPAYASLVRYADGDVAPAICNQALDMGFKDIKLHEVTLAEIAQCRQAIGYDVPLSTDVNCSWSIADTRAWLPKLAELQLAWLEEPIFPPEDFVALARLRAGTGVALAAGENNCTSFQFRDMFAANAVDYAQPSVTKVGGVSEFQKIAALADSAGVTVMPHSPYFGPGFLATLQLAAARGQPGGMIERYHMDLEASLYGELIEPVNGAFAVPQGPGLGRDPDPDVIKTYAA